MRFLWVILSFFHIISLFGQTTPPPNPPPPPFMTGYLPIVLANDSGESNTNVYIVIIARDPTTTEQIVLSINGSGIASITPLTGITNLDSYGQPISNFPTYFGGGVNDRLIYVPHIQSGIIYFSIGSALNMPVNGGAITQPSFLNPTDPNYNTIFDIFELDFQAAVGADATAVSFFSLPLYGYMSQKALSATLQNSGLYQDRDDIFATAESFFNGVVSAAERAEWQKLILTDGSDPLRILSTGKATTAPALHTFDINYLDNAGAYGYSYLEDIWYGATAFYKNNQLYIEIPINKPGTNIRKQYVGQVQPDNTFVFNEVNGASGQVILKAPTTSQSPFTTTQQIFAGENMTQSQSGTGGTDDGIQVSKIVQEGIISGILPKVFSPNPLSEGYLSGHQNDFYEVNTNLSPAGQTSGPWYDLYSKALHSYAYTASTPTSLTPTIYTFAYDEPLWPQVLIAADADQASQTYMAITIGNIGDVATSQTSLTSDNNPAIPATLITFTATVTGSPSGTPTGTVTFTIDGVAGSPVALISGVAQFSTSSLASGEHEIQAFYSGDGTYPSSFSPTFDQLVLGLYTTTELDSSLNPSDVDEDVVFRATITASQSLGAITGTVTFNVDGVDVATNPIVNGDATYELSSLSVGTHQIIARYSGDGTYPSSESEPFEQFVQGNSLTSTPNPAVFGETVTLVYTVIPNPASGEPTGTVVFRIDGVDVATVALVDGHAVLQISTLSVGSHTVIASYSGDDNYPSNVSDPLVQVITAVYVFPPKHVTGKQETNQFVSQKDVINVLKWRAPTKGNKPVLYKIYRDAALTQLIAKVNGSGRAFKYKEHNIKKRKAYTYYIVSVDAFGHVSKPAIEIIQ